MRKIIILITAIFFLSNCSKNEQPDNTLIDVNSKNYTLYLTNDIKDVSVSLMSISNNLVKTDHIIDYGMTSGAIKRFEAKNLTYGLLYRLSSKQYGEYGTDMLTYADGTGNVVYVTIHKHDENSIGKGQIYVTEEWKNE